MTAWIVVGFLERMAWAGTGVLRAAASGVHSSRVVGQETRNSALSGLQFVQIIDSHMGFNKLANTDVNGL